MTGPSAEHETPIALARADPGLLVSLLADHFGLEPPSHAGGKPHSADIQVTQPATYHADAVLVYSSDDGTPVFAVVFEVQRAWDKTKRRTWRIYLAHIEAELNVPAVLLVYCPDPRIGDRYERLAAADGISSVLRPFVVTPRNLPLVTDPARATQQPALTVLSALAHRTDPRITEAFAALAAVLEAVGAQDFETYYDIVLTGLPPTIRTQWEDYMTATATGRRFLSDKLNHLHDQGVAKGKAEGVLTILRVRGIDVPEQVTARIRAADLSQLDEWLQRAATAEALADVIDD